MPLPKPESACFLIADLSGYTNYLAGVELDHAQDIVADILDTIVRVVRPPFRLAKFEGDAAFVYALADKVDGALLQDAVDAAYFTFRRRKRNIRMALVCECKACKTAQTLDLKFVAHHGQMVKQKMGGREELAGSDVILVHRLLKNSVEAKVGGHAYLLCTDAAVKAMDIDPVKQNLIAHRETLESVGEVDCWVRDLEAAWTRENERERHFVSAEESAFTLEFDIAAPRPIVWDYFTSPDHRPKWQGSDGVKQVTAEGRRGVGTKNHCIHGEVASIEEIKDWRPFDYLTITSLMPMPGAVRLLETYTFEDRPDGVTHVEFHIAKPKAKDRAFFEEAKLVVGELYTEGFKRLRELIEGKEPSPAVIAEPEMLPMQERFLTQPVTHKHEHVHGATGSG